jgi:hypothetical protein
MKKKEPKIITWNGMKLVKISDVSVEFRRWLYGQTLPLVDDETVNDGRPFDWAYESDYYRFINNLPIID